MYIILDESRQQCKSWYLETGLTSWDSSTAVRTFVKWHLVSFWWSVIDEIMRIKSHIIRFARLPLCVKTQRLRSNYIWASTSISCLQVWILRNKWGEGINVILRGHFYWFTHVPFQKSSIIEPFDWNIRFQTLPCWSNKQGPALILTLLSPKYEERS